MTAGKLLKFPHDSVLVKLLVAARQTSDTKTIVHDALGFEKSYPELLGDVLKTRQLLWARLPPSAIDDRGLLRGDSQYVAILAKSGYEFLVAFFSIRAMGGVCVPLGSGVLPEEAQYFLSKTNATCMLAGRDSMGRADAIRTHVQDLALFPISIEAAPSRRVEIDDTLRMDPDGPGLVMFSSGTTGLPKGAVLPRRCFSAALPMEPGAVALHYRPANWIGGAASLIQPMLSGNTLYSIRVEAGNARAEAVLEAFRTHRITHARFTPDLLRRMKDLLMGDFSKGDKGNHFRGLSSIMCSAGMLESSTKDFWTDLTGLPFENIYAATELGGPATRGVSGIQGSIGTPMPGIKAKISEGNQGELYIKSPNMFTRYIGDEETTQAAFDDEGYFKTGDLAVLRDGEYIFAGRVNVDYVQFGLYRISTLTVESSLMNLPRISEACVVAVPDNDIRSDLRYSLAPYKLPTLLRILKDGEDLPRTVSGKPIKRQILNLYFGSTDGAQPKTDPPGVERCGWEAAIKPWDFCGLQSAD
ncbi:hypothetical protein G6O67_007904 [Ophiocordyceps sinensis]|uniref:AMP-dependent synthetase/ligase domain-containing protein n=1 Tax=Ophiocordyceps sinensis TaxID=72228 RepID=A0A8H4LRU1_9HYPO|nr:hypothetical protein G6O67_007904 [Ophiocordyceps sinensis]